MLSQYFWKYTVSKKALNFRDNIIPKFKIGQNPFNKNVIVVPHNKITVLSVYNVKLSLNLVVVVMSPVQHDIIPIIDEAEALFPSTQAQIGFILVRVWTLKSHREGHVNNRLTNIFSGFLLSLGLETRLRLEI